MMDLKILNSALEQLEEDREIPKEKILEAIETALAAAYKKDYGKKGQIIRGKFDLESGKTEFSQIKIVVDDTTVKMPEPDDEENDVDKNRKTNKILKMEDGDEQDVRPRFNPEHHILIEDAKKIKKGVELEDEIVFPLEAKDDYGRIAAQTAKQVIIQKIREAEKTSILSEYDDKKDEVVSGIIQRIERGNVFVDLGRVVGVLPAEEQIPGEHYRQGGRIKAFVYDVSESPRGVSIRLSRSNPELIKKLFEIEAPEVSSGVVEIKSVAREAGSRSKIAVISNDSNVDPTGSLVGQKGSRVSTVTNELAGEKIDIIEWSEDPERFVADSLSPAKIVDITIDEEEHKAEVIVDEDQLSLAIGKGGQNVRLANKLTGWKIDIKGVEGEAEQTETSGEEQNEKTPVENKESTKNDKETKDTPDENKTEKVETTENNEDKTKEDITEESDATEETK
jgi:N utilization substance protein A